MQPGAATVESRMELLQKTENGTAFWPSDPTSGNLSEETQNINSEYMNPYVYCNTIYNSQDLEAAQVPISRWVDKKNCSTFTHGILLHNKKEENFTFCDVDGPGEHYGKWIKPVREKQ